MKRIAALFPIALALGAIILVPRAGAQALVAREGPTEIEKCHTISHPGSYKLVNNLTFKGNGTCLPITADFVTIDLGGFTISGPVVPGLNPGGPATAITAGDNMRGITVRNGSISGFTDGVNLPGKGSIVEGLRVFEGDAVGIAANGIVKGNTVIDFNGPGPNSG